MRNLKMKEYKQFPLQIFNNAENLATIGVNSDGYAGIIDKDLLPLQFETF